MMAAETGRSIASSCCKTAKVTFGTNLLATFNRHHLVWPHHLHCKATHRSGVPYQMRGKKMRRGLVAHGAQLIKFPDLEFEPCRHLCRSRPAEVRSDAARDQAEASRTQVVIRIAQIRVVQDICKRAFRFQMHALGQGDALA